MLASTKTNFIIPAKTFLIPAGIMIRLKLEISKHFHNVIHNTLIIKNVLSIFLFENIKSCFHNTFVIISVFVLFAIIKKNDFNENNIFFYVFLIFMFLLYQKVLKKLFFFINSEFTLDLINLYLFYITIITLNLSINLFFNVFYL